MRFPIAMTASLATYIMRKRVLGERFIPLVLMLEPLFMCNLSCSTCGRIREYKDSVSEKMTLDECLDSSRECGAPVVSVCGGEPLIYPEIGELVQGLIDDRRFVYLCTNGVLLKKTLDKLPMSGRFFLNVHIDGPREVHDAVVEHPGAYDAAVEGIARAAERGFQITVNTTVCKQTDMGKIEAHMSELEEIGVQSFMLSPAYSYGAVDDKECFLDRDGVHEKFRNIDSISAQHCLSDTPIYLEYLKGDRELACTAWGNPTRNVRGWRSPCYLLADRHYSTYRELVENTDWSLYGVGKDARCRDCMVHCGFEPTVALGIGRRPGDLMRMLKWQLSRNG